MVIRFEIERETKNTVRYKEIPEAETGVLVGTLYVQKWALTTEFGEFPDELFVTIEDVDME